MAAMITTNMHEKPHAFAILLTFCVSRPLFHAVIACALQYGKPFRIAECNSFYGGGLAGASNVFAATLVRIAETSCMHMV